MKIDFKKLLASVVRIGTPIVAAIVLHRVTTGKIDVKGAVLDAAQRELDNRVAATEASTSAAHELARSALDEVGKLSGRALER